MLVTEDSSKDSGKDSRKDSRKDGRKDGCKNGHKNGKRAPAAKGHKTTTGVVQNTAQTTAAKDGVVVKDSNTSDRVL